jgi:tripartite-type tricarboxylate transporter receptor subunit TctC
MGAVAAMPAAAQSAADFYRGRTVTLSVGLSAGGTYGLFGRLLTAHWANHIPGKPAMVTQFMTGAGGLTGANHLGNAAPRDGSFFALLFKDAVITQALRPKAAKYDARRFRWVGRMQIYNAVLLVSGKSGVRTLDDAKKREVLMGATSGKATGSYMLPIMANAILGTRFKVISGYKGAAGMNLAMERGETHGWAGGAFMGYKGVKFDEFRNGQVVMLMQSGEARDALIPDVPLLRELAKDEATREVVNFIDSSNVIGFSIATPPGVPDSLVAALRASFDATMADPAFIADVKKRKFELTPMKGAPLQRYVGETLKASPAVIKRAREMLKL